MNSIFKKTFFCFLLITFSIVSNANEPFDRVFKTDTLKVLEPVHEKKLDAHQQIYEAAFQKYMLMLEGKSKLDFKKAVFLYENAYHNDSLSYEAFSNHFTQTAKMLNAFIRKKGISQYKTAGQYAIFTYMFEPSSLNDSTVFKYDFNDFMGENNWSNMFVTKIIKTKTGNCHGLPYYYKILSNELHASSFLALGPNHMYIKHVDEEGNWVNIELTNGHISSDAWLMTSLNISTEAIKSGIYMDALNEKESVALCLWDLAMCYQSKYGYDDFVLKCCDAVLKYYPTSINALITKYNCKIAEAEKHKNENIEAYDQEIKAIEKQMQKLGYRDFPGYGYDQFITNTNK